MVPGLARPDRFPDGRCLHTDTFRCLEHFVWPGLTHVKAQNLGHRISMIPGPHKTHGAEEAEEAPPGTRKQSATASRCAATSCCTDATLHQRRNAHLADTCRDDMGSGQKAMSRVGSRRRAGGEQAVSVSRVRRASYEANRCARGASGEAHE